MKTLAPLALRSFLVLSALLATACGGEEPAIAEQAQSLSESSGPRTTDGNCSSVCHEVVACCICKCHEDYPSPGSYACDAGCLVLDTIFGSRQGDDIARSVARTVTLLMSKTTPTHRG